jgi:L-arabinose isomerase
MLEQLKEQVCQANLDLCQSANNEPSCIGLVAWIPRPNLPTAAAAWIYAGGSHHPTFSQALTTEYLEDYAEMVGLECIVIDSETRLREFK